MPKQKQSDGTVKVEFKTKDGKTVLFSRKPGSAKKEKKETPAPKEEAAEPTQTSASSGTANKKKSGEKDRPTDLQPVLVLSDD